MPAEIFEHADFLGRKQTLYPGFYNIDQLSFGNDTISSLKTYDTRVTLIEHHNGVGARWSFMGNVPYVGGFWNDKTSSILVEGGFPNLNNPNLEPQIIVFEHIDYQGGYQILKPGFHDMHQIALPNDSISSVMRLGRCKAWLHRDSNFGPAALLIWENMPNLGEYYNDVVSSIEVFVPQPSIGLNLATHQLILDGENEKY